MENIVFNDYANWLIEYDELLKDIKDKAVFLYDRYKHIFNVVTHIYNMKVDKKDISDDEADIFAAGFTFLFEQTQNIQGLNKSFFNNKIELLAKEQKKVSLYLDLQEFIKDLENILENEVEYKALKDIEDELYSSFQNKTPLREEIFEEFNVASMDVYRENNINFYPIKEIFYDIAEIYNLI